jgi:hypothetical protein
LFQSLLLCRRARRRNRLGARGDCDLQREHAYTASSLCQDRIAGLK